MMVRRGLLLALLMLPGCASEGTSSAGGGSKRTDACATELHELSGDLLTYYAARGNLPDELPMLTEVTGKPVAAPWHCVASGQRYRYEPRGVALPLSTDRAVVFAAGPDRAGKRWAIVIHEPTDGAPLLTRVLHLSESMFAENPGN